VTVLVSGSDAAFYSLSLYTPTGDASIPLAWGRVSGVSNSLYLVVNGIQYSAHYALFNIGDSGMFVAYFYT
jgi:hypothetical protein